MKKIIERKMSKSKGYEYHLDNHLKTSDIVNEMFNRIIMLSRGLFKKIPLKKAGKKFFVGKKVKIKSGNRIEFGNFITINDGCYINALSKCGIKVGDNFSLGRNSIIDCTGVISELGESLLVGNNVGISPNFTLFVRGKVSIGNDVIIGPNVTIVAENHKFNSLLQPIRLQGTCRKGIIIGDNCWIGANVVILDGVNIGRNSIIAAGAVVNRDVDENTIVGGIPARFIKRRE